MAERRRLDRELVRRGLAAGRDHASELIAQRRVLVGGALADKPARLVAAGDAVEVLGPPRRFVSRGGDKLDAALDRFGIDPADLRVLDAGASTGGFTDCVLQRGAAHVVAVDVGHGQLDAGIRSDPRVSVKERLHVRDLGGAGIGEVDLVVADLSFISLRSVVAPLVEPLRLGGSLVALVKPQFEAGREAADRGRGVIRDPGLWRQALVGVIAALDREGATIMGAMPSPIRGSAGNVEFLLHARRDGRTTDLVEAPPAEDLVDAVVAEAESSFGPSVGDGRS